MDSLQDDNDSRPTISPYGSNLVQLYFKKKGPLHVPRQLLKGSPIFAGSHGGESSIYLEDVALNAGHVLVHFLYTGTYQCLKPGGQSPQARRTSEFETSLEVFSLARVYRLPLLRALATKEIERLGDGLSLPCILDVLDDVHHALCDEDEWLETYVASRTRSELSALDGPRADALLLEVGCATTINKVLLRTLVERELDEVVALKEELEVARRTLATEQEKTHKAKRLPSVDHLEVKSPVVMSKELVEDKPAEDKPTEQEYDQVEAECRYPPANAPSMYDYRDSNRGNDSSRTNFWDSVHVSDFSNVQYYQPEGSDLDQDLASTGQGNEKHDDPLLRVSPTPPESPPPAPLPKKDKKKSKKKVKRLGSLASTPPPSTPPPVIEEKKAYEAKAEGV
ncbi:hypothetical protein QQZ08_005281 [Neonectria magnoliae]|uniref:BTB domain-containing protein n=1 Tax=Neonectria magnoliae TaxID=2732573 RepID=A0ABR1I420_9HYPO